MAALSFRDRFFTPPVAHAVTSPSGILAAGAGMALGVIAAPAALPLTVLGAVIGGALGYGARVALAIPRAGKGAKINAFAVEEPWRHAVMDAVASRDRFADALKGFKPGPLRDSLTEVGNRLDEAVDESWKIAQQGQLLTDARKRLNDRQVNWELTQAHYAVTQGGEPTPTQASTIAALEAQLATSQRMDQTIADARDQLRLLNARLDEAVTRAVELSVTEQTSGAAALGDDVGAIVDDLESLRLALDDLDDEPAGVTAAPPAPATLPPAPAPSTAVTPPPLPATEPPPLPDPPSQP